MAIIKRIPRLVDVREADCDIYIGRGSRWGNPFRIGRYSTREEAVDKHMNWLQQWIKYKKRIVIDGYDNRWVIGHLKQLERKALGCFCFPLPCHGDNLITLVKERLWIKK